MLIGDIIRRTIQLFNLNDHVDRLIAGDWIEQINLDGIVINVTAAAIRSNILTPEISKETLGCGSASGAGCTSHSGRGCPIGTGHGDINGDGAGDETGCGFGSGVRYKSIYELRLSPSTENGTGCGFGSGGMDGAGDGHGAGFGFGDGVGGGFDNGIGFGFGTGAINCQWAGWGNTNIIE